MSECRWDREAEDYLLPDGSPCRTDAYGDPTRHCTARRTCAEHVGWGELTCARCIGRTRMDIRVIRDRSVELFPVALHAGVDSEAAMLAGPAADVEAWSWRKVAAKQGRAWHVSLMEDDDEHHPYTVLTRWEFMLRDDYDQQRDDPTSISAAADYLERILPRLAHDDEQDFPLFARELRKCRQHLENVLQDGTQPERGAPCPDCKDEGHVVRMVREYGHWCEAEDCERIHYLDDTGDRWVCPRNRDHWRSEEDYRRWVADVYEANRSAS